MTRKKQSEILIIISTVLAFLYFYCRFILNIKTIGLYIFCIMPFYIMFYRKKIQNESMNDYLSNNYKIILKINAEYFKLMSILLLINILFDAFKS